MAAYSQALRSAHHSAQSILEKVAHVLLTHEPGRPRPFVVHLRSPSRPAQSQGYCFETDAQATVFLETLVAEATGAPAPEEVVELVAHTPAPPAVSTPRRRRGAKATAGADEEDDAQESGEDADD